MDSVRDAASVAIDARCTPPAPPDQTSGAPLLTKHFLALMCIASNPEIRLLDIARELAITERRAYTIVKAVTEAGYVVKEKTGRRILYQIQDDLVIPELVEQGLAIGEVLDLLVSTRKHPRTDLFAPH